MRKILYSPGFGAGWTTWNSGPVAEYMLTYQPIIDFLEGGGKFTAEDCHLSYVGDEPSTSTLHPLLQQLWKDCEEKFGEPYVCVLGARDLKVKTVSGRVRIEDYDGNESVEEEGSFSGWM